MHHLIQCFRNFLKKVCFSIAERYYRNECISICRILEVVVRRRGLAGMVLGIVACAVLVVVVGDGVVWYLRSTVADGEFCASRVVDGVENRCEAVAWLRVDGTGIDAPVMQHVGDDAFYLSHDADGVLGSIIKLEK